jgi:hypothetical protein
MRGIDRLHDSDKGVDHLGAKNAIGAQFPLNELKGIHPLGFFCMNNSLGAIRSQSQIRKNVSMSGTSSRSRRSNVDGLIVPISVAASRKLRSPRFVLTLAAKRRVSNLLPISLSPHARSQTRIVTAIVTHDAATTQKVGNLVPPLVETRYDAIFL